MDRFWYKRPFDLSLAILGCIIFAPLFFLFSFLIWEEDHGTIFYRQIRLGKGVKRFKLFKFRSMTTNSEEVPTHDIKDGDSRIHVTKVGRFLRSCAMDELPQLINIIKGDMSFVGPRPLMPCEAAILLDKEGLRLRSSIRPGLTGLAQITIDKYMSNDEKLKYDLKYINGRGFWFDIKLIMGSCLITLGRKWETKWQKEC